MILTLVRRILRVLSRLTVVLFILFIAAVAAFIWSYTNYQDAKNQLNTTQTGQPISEKEISKITRAVARHMVLPEGTPTIAIIEDITALANQPFFKNAQNGDVVLIYPEQAIIYNPSRDVIINVGPVINNQDAKTSAAAEVPKADTTVEIRNGSTTSGRASIVGSEVEALAGFKVSATSNAKDKNYDNTIVVNLKGKDVAALEKKFGVTAVATMPSGEASSQADVVVILGNK